jgi:hypothetical protein
MFLRRSLREYDGDGRLRVTGALISRACVNLYKGFEVPGYERLGLEPDRVFRFWRDPHELQAAAPSFNGIPILSEHVPTSVTTHRPELVLGTLGTNCRLEGRELINDATIWVADAIKQILNGQKAELSCGYSWRADFTPGTFNGQEYDGVMRDIRGHHAALVARSRINVVIGDGALSPRRWAA